MDKKYKMIDGTVKDDGIQYNTEEVEIFPKLINGIYGLARIKKLRILHTKKNWRSERIVVKSKS